MTVPQSTTKSQLVQFLVRALAAAQAANHVWPAYAACEAAIESRWGRSAGALDNNLFGMKQHKHPVYGTHNLPTKEWNGSLFMPEVDAFVVYPDWASCFRDRMDTLRRLAPSFPHYQRALDAKTGESYIREVSQSWSTDPHRAANVLTVYLFHCRDLEEATLAAPAQAAETKLQAAVGSGPGNAGPSPA